MKNKRKLLNALMLSLSSLSVGTLPCYATVDDFFRDPKTQVQFSDVYENEGKVKVTALGNQGNRQEYLEVDPKINVVKWTHYDNADPPYSAAIYKVQVLLGLKMHNDFPNYESSAKTFHTAGKEEKSEDQVPAGQWGNMYKDKTYIRPDTTEHVKKTVAGQYMIDHKEERVQEQIKLCTRTSEIFSQWQQKTRHHIDRADVYKITNTRYEKSGANAAHPVSTSLREEYRNRRYEGEAPTCGDRKLHG